MLAKLTVHAINSRKTSVAIRACPHFQFFCNFQLQRFLLFVSTKYQLQSSDAGFNFYAYFSDVYTVSQKCH